MDADACSCSPDHYPRERISSTGSCYTCLFTGLSQQIQAIVDQSLYERHFLLGMKTLHDNLLIGFSESKSVYVWRYQHLRKVSPNLFPYPDTEYWMIG